MNKIVILILVFYTSAAQSSCDPETMGFFDYLKCGNSGVQEHIEPYQEELERQNDITEYLEQENLSLKTENVNYQTRIARLKDINDRLEYQVEALESAIHDYNLALSNRDISIESRERYTNILVYQLTSYSNNLDEVSSLGDMSYDEFKKIRQAIGLASDINSYNKLRVKVQNARGTSQKIKVVARGVANRTVGKIAGKALFRAIPGVGWALTGLEVISAIFS